MIARLCRVYPLMRLRAFDAMQCTTPSAEEQVVESGQREEVVFGVHEDLHLAYWLTHQAVQFDPRGKRGGIDLNVIVVEGARGRSSAESRNSDAGEQFVG